MLQFWKTNRKQRQTSQRMFRVGTIRDAGGKQCFFHYYQSSSTSMFFINFFMIAEITYIILLLMALVVSRYTHFILIAYRVKCIKIYYTASQTISFNQCVIKQKWSFYRIMIYKCVCSSISKHTNVYVCLCVCFFFFSYFVHISAYSEYQC